jgi:hypothetical protein
MAEIVNLRLEKKQRKRVKKRADGTENATRYGQTKASRSLDAALVKKARDTLDAHRLEEPED